MTRSALEGSFVARNIKKMLVEQRAVKTSQGARNEYLGALVVVVVVVVVAVIAVVGIGKRII